ncbi:hypothetical protein K439DRAFT_1354097 [Ramaria rubella]|nr:hypothetical protein K439DRAFT_1354097 [Ramaria rubella]
MSTSKIPQIFEVIPIIDVLTATLDQYSSNKALFPAVCAAAAKGHEILNKYYSLTNDLIIYQVAMILHSWYKTLYFQRQKWPDSRIDTTITLVHEQWECNYKPQHGSHPTVTKVSIFSDLDIWPLAY